MVNSAFMPFDPPPEKDQAIRVLTITRNEESFDPAAMDEWSLQNVTLCSRRQQRILADVLPALKKEGILIYSTCSYSKEENEEIVADFLARHPAFARVPVNEVLARRHIPLEMPDDTLRLLPHRHHTDGFYAAVLQRSLEK